MLITLFKNYKNKPVKLFFLSAIIFSIFEYITDFFLQALFATKWWDYTGEFLNLNGRITLSFSIVWGIAAILFIKFVQPFVTKIVGKILSKIPAKAQKIIANTLVSIIIIDTLASSVCYLNIF